ncbi:MAG: GIY-YIG nuclease family protein [Chloroflexota bacterium]
MSKQYYVYIMTNQLYTVLYTGVTSDLKKRVWEHRQGLAEGFSKRYKANHLVYYEATADVESAIAREKQIKAYRRQKKLELIDGFNLEWRDLYEEI